MHMDQPLLDAIEALTKVHRLLVEDDKGHHVMAHLDVIRYLMKNHESLQSALHQKMQDAGLSKSEVIAVEEDVPALNVMRHLKEDGVSGVGVLNKEGKLVANISDADFIVRLL